MSEADPSTPGPSALSEAEFAAELKAAAPTLWCIAAGVLGSRTDVEDVVQDAAIIGLRKVESFERGTSFSAWMGQIVRNVARNRARQARRERGAPLEAAPGQESPPMGPETEFDRRVLAALQGLDDTARACLLLRTVREMTYRDIAAVLDIPEGTAMSHVSRARKRLRDRLRHHEDLVPGMQDGA